jgi:anti-sigma B factor antagonist
MNTDYLEGTAQGAQVWVRINGRGNFKLGPTLKAYVVSAIQRGCRRLMVDMQGCTAMDSTFMGVLAGLAMHLKGCGGTVVVVRLAPQLREALTTLGLDRLLQLPTSGESAAPVLQRLDITPDLANAAANILAAHENLITAHPENRPRFNELVTQLKNEINSPV